MQPIVLTHCGKLGDFIHTWPIAAWLHKTTGRKIHWVLPMCFKPFRQIKSLAEHQTFHHDLTLVDYPVQTYGCGGQPYRFNPRKYGIRGEYYNLGFRDYPDTFATDYQAQEHGFTWDRSWVLNLGEPIQSEMREMVVMTEQKCMPSLPHQRIDLNKDVLFNAKRMASAYERHCYFSGVATILYFAKIPFVLYRNDWHARNDYYFLDSSLIQRIVHLKQGKRNRDNPYKTKCILIIESIKQAISAAWADRQAKQSLIRQPKATR